MSAPLLLDPPTGVRITFRGECNRCGLCCTVEHEGRTLVCQHLRAEKAPGWRGVIGGAQPLGTPMASRCAVYELRTDGMPILMLDGRGEPRLQGICAKDTWLEDRRQWERIGQGCSLAVKVFEGQLVKFDPDPHAPKREI